MIITFMRLLERIKAKTVKINRHHQGVSQFQQNRFFRNNEGRFDEQIDESQEGGQMEIPDTQEQKHFGQILGTKKWNIVKIQPG